jgi:hypothetical protein
MQPTTSYVKTHLGQMCSLHADARGSARKPVYDVHPIANVTARTHVTVASARAQQECIGGAPGLAAKKVYNATDSELQIMLNK